jgi:hypothetical protein
MLERGAPVESDDLGGGGARHQRRGGLIVGQPLVAESPQPQQQSNQSDCSEQPYVAAPQRGHRCVDHGSDCTLSCGVSMKPGG